MGEDDCALGGDLDVRGLVDDTAYWTDSAMNRPSLPSMVKVVVGSMYCLRDVRVRCVASTVKRAREPP